MERTMIAFRYDEKCVSLPFVHNHDFHFVLKVKASEAYEGAFNSHQVRLYEAMDH